MKYDFYDVDKYEDEKKKGNEKKDNKTRSKEKKVPKIKANNINDAIKKLTEAIPISSGDIRSAIYLIYKKESRGNIITIFDELKKIMNMYYPHEISPKKYVLIKKNDDKK